MKDFAREVAEHHAQLRIMRCIVCNVMRHHVQHHAQHHAQHGFARSIKPQHRALTKLIGQIVKHDAKLAHQNSQKLRVSTDSDVLTICFSAGGSGGVVPGFP